MAITLILHEATRTGAPRIGALIARELQRDEPVRVIVMKDGPLTPWLIEQLGEDQLMICRGDEFGFRRPFEERLQEAETLLAREASDLVYANSLATSVFALAAARLRRKTLLHVHEKTADMINLLAHDVTKLEVLRAADALVLAAAEIGVDVAQVFKTAPAEVAIFGVAADAEAVRAGAQEKAPPARNAAGEPLLPGERAVVGMCGHASARKGADVFLHTAAALPNVDFLWVGGWRPEETPDNVAYAEFISRALPNLYVAGSVANPYPYMQAMDLFFLSSREDPNPVVIAEAAILGVPVLCFSRATAIADRLGRSAILCYGASNAADAARVIGASAPEALRSHAFREAGSRLAAEYDLKTKMDTMRDLIARLRGTATAPERARA